MDPVGRQAAGPLDRHVAAYRDGRAEQDQHLVDQVRSQIEPHPIAFRLAPALSDQRTVPIKTALDGDDVAETTGRDLGLKGQEIGVPAAVLEYRNQAAGLCGQGDQTFGVGQCGGERLVDDDRLAGADGGLGLGGVQGVGSGEDDEADIRIGEDGLEVRDDAGVGIDGADVIGTAADDSVQGQVGTGGDQGGVEGLAGVAEADDGGIRDGGHLSIRP